MQPLFDHGYHYFTLIWPHLQYNVLELNNYPPEYNNTYNIVNHL